MKCVGIIVVITHTVTNFCSAKDEDVKCKVLPEEDEFSRGLYTMDMGQNDLHYFLVSMTEEQAKESISSVIDQFAVVVEVMLSMLD